MRQALSAAGVLAAAVLLAACHSLPQMKPSGMDNSAFMNLWATYQNCETGQDAESMRVDALRLAEAAIQARPVAVQVPKPLQQYVSDPPHRLAVDPMAMAAACSLHAGQRALTAGRTMLADEMYRLVLTYPEAQYPYYVSQARIGLGQISDRLLMKTAPLVAGSPLASRVAD